MIRDIKELNFREIDQNFLVVIGISDRVKVTMKSGGFPISSDYNGVLVYGYIALL